MAVDPPGKFTIQFTGGTFSPEKLGTSGVSHCARKEHDRTRQVDAFPKQVRHVHNGVDVIRLRNCQDFPVETVSAANQDTLPEFIEQVEAVLVTKNGRIDRFAVIYRGLLPGQAEWRVRNNHWKRETDPTHQRVDLLEIALEHIVRAVLTRPVFVDLDSKRVFSRYGLSRFPEPAVGSKTGWPLPTTSVIQMATGSGVKNC